MLKILYLGSGEIGLPTLEFLARHSRHTLVGVVTQPDRPAGRHQVLTPPAVKRLAQTLAPGVPILQPEKIRRPEAIEALRALAPDVIVVFAYGQILPRAVLDLPRLACWNIHASLLPRWRGAAPIQAAIAAGDAETGLTVIWMNAGLDTGDILLQKPVPLAPDTTGGSLHDLFAALAPPALEEALALLEAGNAPRVPQDDALATLAPKLERASGRIDWTGTAAAIVRHVRAMNPWPGAFTTAPAAAGGPEAATDSAGSRRWKIFAATVLPRTFLPAAAPGTATIVDGHRLAVAAGDGHFVELHELQLEGKKRLPAADFLRGVSVAPGTVLGGAE